MKSESQVPKFYKIQTIIWILWMCASKTNKKSTFYMIIYFLNVFNFLLDWFLINLYIITDT